jgi:hypothetical protein
MDGLYALDIQEAENYLPGQLMLLKKGIIAYSEYMKELGKMPEAKEVIKKGYVFFANDNEYKIAYDDITRG